MKQEDHEMIPPEEMESIEFLQRLGATYVNRVAMMAQLKDCLEGTVLFSEGCSSPFIYFVLSGEIRLAVKEYAGESVEGATVGPGSLLGWSPLLGHAMTATARTATRCRLAVLETHEIL